MGRRRKPHGGVLGHSNVVTQAPAAVEMADGGCRHESQSRTLSVADRARRVCPNGAVSRIPLAPGQARCTRS